MRRSLLVLLLTGLLPAFAAAVLAQVPPDPAQSGGPLPAAGEEAEVGAEVGAGVGAGEAAEAGVPPLEPAAAEAETAGQGEPGAEDDAELEGDPETELAVEPADIFVPTEEVDEDYSIPFPTDI